MEDLQDKIIELMDLFDNERIPFDNGGEVKKLADNFVKQEELLGRSVSDELRKEYIDALKKETSKVQTDTFKYPFKFLNQRTGEIETVYKALPTDYSKRSKRVSTKIDTYSDALTDFNAAIRDAFIKNDASLFPKPFAQFLKDKGLKDGTYSHLVKTKQIPSINTDVSDFRFKFANRLIDDANKDLKFIDAGTLFKNAGFTDKDVKKVYSLKDKKLNKLDKAEDKIKKAYIKYFQSPASQNLPVKTFFNPRTILAGATGLTETTVSKKFDIQKFDPEGFETFKRLGNADIQKILLKNFDPATTIANPNAFTLGAIKEKINADIKAGNKPFSFYMDTAQLKSQKLRKDRLEVAAKKAGEGVADINAAQDELIATLNKFYKDNPQELLNNTKLRNLLDLTLKDGEIVKKNKYVTDEDFLKLIKEKTGLFTKDHVDEVQFEKMSTEFPIFKQLATYNTNSGLIKSIKSYVAKNQNSKDPVVQDKIKKQIAFLEDLKLRVDTPTGRVGSKEVLDAVDRQAGTLPNFLAQLKALNIKLPAKAKAVLLGTGGGLAATTLAAAGPIEETGSTAMDTAKTVGAGTAGALAVGTKKGRNILGKFFRAAGTPIAGPIYAGLNIADKIKSGSSVTDAVIDPLTGLELSFPGLFKENLKKITTNPTAQKILSLGYKIPKTAFTVGRALTPIGAGITAAGLAKDYSEFVQRELERKAADPEAYRAEQQEQMGMSAADGGRAGFKVGSLRKGIQALIDESVKSTPKDTTSALDKLIKKTLNEDFFDKKDRIIDTLNAKIARERKKFPYNQQVQEEPSQLEFYDDITKSNFRTKTGEYFDRIRRNKAGGGLLKQAGDRSGPPPESGPNPQGLQGLLNRVKKV